MCSTYINGFAATAYFAMLSGQGWTAIAGCRQFFYARSVNVQYVQSVNVQYVLNAQVIKSF